MHIFSISYNYNLYFILQRFINFIIGFNQTLNIFPLIQPSYKSNNYLIFKLLMKIFYFGKFLGNIQPSIYNSNILFSSEFFFNEPFTCIGNRYYIIRFFKYPLSYYSIINICHFICKSTTYLDIIASVFYMHPLFLPSLRAPSS